jgi:hypothetical protein
MQDDELNRQNLRVKQNPELSSRFLDRHIKLVDPNAGHFSVAALGV